VAKHSSDEYDFDNFGNTIKRLFPEFNDVASMSQSGPLPNMVQREFDAVVNKGFDKIDEMTPVQRFYRMKELSNA